RVEWVPCHRLGGVGPMAGVVSPSMWVWVLHDEVHDRTSWCTLNEGLGAVLRYGAYAPEVIDRLRWMGAVLGPALQAAVRRHGPELQSGEGSGNEGSTVVTAMARNVNDFGIQVAGTGDAWCTGPAAVPDGLFLGGYGPDDANPDIGDSAITETAGLGGFAMAGAPAIVRFVGGTVSDALRTTREMYEITVAENPAYPLPVLAFRGAPPGIDAARCV